MCWYRSLTQRLLAHWPVLHSERGAAAPHPLPQDRIKSDWDATEVAALTTAMQRSLFCYASCPASAVPMQSVILGFDSDTSHILLDEFFPLPASGVFDQSIDISVPCHEGFLHLNVVIVDRLKRADNCALIAKIVQRRVDQQRSTLAKVTFAEGAGPTVDVLVPLVPFMRGKVTELSIDGLIASIPQLQKPVLHTRRGSCSLVLEFGLKIQAKVSVKEISFHRKPFRHSLVHLKFDPLQAEQRDQLMLLIAQFSTTEDRTEAA